MPDSLDLAHAWRDGYGSALAFHPTHPLLASDGEDEMVRLWSLGAEPSVQQSAAQPDRVEGLAFDPPGQHLVVASRFRDQSLRRYRLLDPPA